MLYTHRHVRRKVAGYEGFAAWSPAGMVDFLYRCRLALADLRGGPQTRLRFTGEGAAGLAPHGHYDLYTPI